jgi:anti-anti-sigma factor
MPKRFTPVVENKHGCLWIVLPDSIDMDSCNAIEERILPLLEDSEGRVALDFSRTTAIYSSGLGLVVRMQSRIHDHGGTLHLVNLSDRMVEALANVGLDKVMSIHKTEDELKAHLGSASAD